MKNRARDRRKQEKNKEQEQEEDEHKQNKKYEGINAGSVERRAQHHRNITGKVGD